MADLAPTLGPYVVRWIEKFVVHGPGDMVGQPFVLRPDQRLLVYRMYELNPDGTRRWRRICLGRARGYGKTSLMAALALAELAGPVRFDGWDDAGRPRARMVESPMVQLGAVSFDQANLLFSAAKLSVEGGPLAEFLTCLDTEIRFADGRPGMIKRIASGVGTNEGALPSAVFLDETHELHGERRLDYYQRVRLATTKRHGAVCVEITTAGQRHQGSIAEGAWELGRKIATGEVPETDTLVDWLEASPHWNLDDPDELEAAVREANPSASDARVRTLIATYHDPATPSHAFRRFILNTWVDSLDDGWLADHPMAWAACEGAPRVRPGDKVWAGLDVSLYNDSTALVWGTVRDDGKFHTQSSIWLPENRHIDHNIVLDAIRELHAKYALQTVYFDPAYFELGATMLIDEGVRMIAYPQSTERMTPACMATFQAIVDGDIVHAGDPTMTAQVVSAARKPNHRGWTLSKGRARRSRIDAAIALVLAYWAAKTYEAPPSSSRGPARLTSF